MTLFCTRVDSYIYRQVLTGFFGCAKFNFASNSFAATLYKRVLTGKFLLSLISDLSYSQKKNIWFYCPPCPAFLSQNLYVCTVCTCLKRLSQATAHSVDFAQDCFHMTFVKNFFPNFLSLIWNIFGQKESKKLHRVPNKQKPRKKKDELKVVHQIEMEKIPAWWNRAQFSYTLYILE